MTHQEPHDQLVTIGEFARMSRLTTKALRIYDSLDLLRPATVDPSNGYRYYRTDQLEPARVIGLLRGADMGLEDIGRVLASHEDTARKILDRFLEDLERTHSSRRLLIRHVHSILRIDTESSIMFPIHTRTIESQRVMSIQRRLHVAQLDSFVTEAKAAFAAHLGDADPTGPFTVVFHGIVDEESDGPVEAMLGCPGDIQPTESIGVRTEPTHDEAFTTITKAQWQFPAILGAYDAVACSPEVLARPGSSLSCREVYLAEANTIGDDDLICDIAFPLA